MSKAQVVNFSKSVQRYRYYTLTNMHWLTIAVQATVLRL